MDFESSLMTFLFINCLFGYFFCFGLDVFNLLLESSTLEPADDVGAGLADGEEPLTLPLPFEVLRD